MARKSRKFHFWHIWRAMAPQYVVFMENGGQPHRNIFYLLSEYDKSTEKPCFNQEIWLFENST